MRNSYTVNPLRFSPPCDVFDISGAPQPNGYFDGLFYQPGTPEIVRDRRETIASFAITGSFDDLPIDVYQKWVELDWKAPHCTVTAHERFGAKLLEEGIVEYRDELDQAPRDLVMPPNQAELIDEQGDSLWTSVALVSNAGVSLEPLASRFMKNERLTFILPEIVTLGDIDEVIAGGFVPSAVRHGIDPAMVDDWDDELDPMQDSYYTAAFLIYASGLLFDLVVFKDEEGPLVESNFYRHTERLGHYGTEYLFLLGYLANKSAKSSLAEVALLNYKKVSGRVATNAVDKTDGNRPPKPSLP